MSYKFTLRVSVEQMHVRRAAFTTSRHLPHDAHRLGVLTIGILLLLSDNAAGWLVLSHATVIRPGAR